MLVIVLVTALILMIVDGCVATGHERTALEQQAHRLARTVAASEEQAVRATLASFSVLTAATQAFETYCSFLPSVGGFLHSLGNLALVNADGTIVCASRDVAPGAAVAGPWFDAARDQPGYYVISEPAATPLAAEATPMLAQRNTPRGPVFVGALNLQAVANRLHLVPLPAHSSIELVSARGIVLASTQTDRQGNKSGHRGGAMPAAFLHAVTGRSDGTFQENGADGIRRLYGFARLDLVDQPLMVLVGLPSSAASRTRALANITILSAVAAVVYVLSRRPA